MNNFTNDNFNSSSNDVFSSTNMGTYGFDYNLPSYLNSWTRDEVVFDPASGNSGISPINIEITETKTDGFPLDSRHRTLVNSDSSIVDSERTEELVRGFFVVVCVIAISMYFLFQTA